jgi:isopentenyldiphosphate isomerase
VPEHLQEKIGLFETQGQLGVSHDRLFDKSSWQAVLTGMGVIPRCHHPFADMGDFDKIHRRMQAERTGLEAAVQDLPDYRGSLLK